MAGEWIQYDVGLPRKPETLALVDATGLENATVCGRLQAMWGWASLNSLDGTVRISVRLLAKAAGGDEAFWYAVQDVGWLVIDEANGTVAIPGWDRRFSKAAKNRAMHAIRAEEAKTRTSGCAKAQPRVRGGALERRERGDGSSSSSPGDSELGEPGSGPAQEPTWDALRKAWAKGTGRSWALPGPPDKVLDRLAEPGWFEKALAAIEALPRCLYFRDPVTLPQLVSPGFVDKVLGGQFDNAREQRLGPRPGPDDRKPAATAAAEWSRAAADPEAARRREEYLAAKARKAAGTPDTAAVRAARDDHDQDEIERARATVLAQLKGAV
jgi:hypothetical protein